MTIEDLETELMVMLRAFRAGYRVERLIKSISFQLVVHQFGLVVTGLVASEYKIVSDSVSQAFPDYRKVYIAHTDNVAEKKEEVLWQLMRGGYMSWLRKEYARDFKNLVTMQEFGKKIINKRLEIWGEAARHRYLVNYNKAALLQPATYLLSIDPSFYDYMPEGD